MSAPLCRLKARFCPEVAELLLARQLPVGGLAELPERLARQLRRPRRRSLAFPRCNS
jgi:hypothetical protein